MLWLFFHWEKKEPTLPRGQQAKWAPEIT